ncbi:MAG: hypothetical protein HYZ95_01650, partial [Candidatus Omnitrophica bacterium]|nr:hypothetical protein [Candidatus Omnitrophota bacterium]
MIRRAASSRRPKLSLAPGAIVSKEQRSSGLGVELYRAYAAVTISKSVPELAGWPSALKAAGLDPGEIYRESWDREKVVEVIQRAASSRRPKLSLAPGAIQSAGQRSSGLGAELYHA